MSTIPQLLESLMKNCGGKMHAAVSHLLFHNSFIHHCSSIHYHPCIHPFTTIHPFFYSSFIHSSPYMHSSIRPCAGVHEGVHGRVDEGHQLQEQLLHFSPEFRAGSHPGGWMDGWMDGGIVGWMDGWRNG